MYVCWPRIEDIQHFCVGELIDKVSVNKTKQNKVKVNQEQK